MKKTNYGIPAGLLCITAYILGMGSVLWVLLGLTILTFALGFEPKVKAAVVQSLGLTIIFTILNSVYVMINSFLGYTDILKNVNLAINAAEFIIFAVAIIAVFTKNDIIIENVKKIVEE